MIMSLWASAPVFAGGLGYATGEIGSILAITGAALIFNCQAGRGRTTSGMVVACLVLLSQRGWRVMDAPPRVSSNDNLDEMFEEIARQAEAGGAGAGAGAGGASATLVADAQKLSVFSSPACPNLASRCSIWNRRVCVHRKVFAFRLPAVRHR